MTIGKRLLRSAAGQAAVAHLAALYVAIVFHTTRWSWRGFEAPDRLIAARRPYVYCFWHGRLLVMPYIQRGTMRHDPRRRMRHTMLGSGHRDGRLMARTIAIFGVGSLEGSTSRGSATGLRQCLRALKTGISVGITPDGPRGPRMRAAKGAIELARLAGVPILPVTCATTRRRILPSWDRFIVPLPFGRGIFIVGEALEVPAKAGTSELEAARQELERRLNAISSEADRLTGHAPIEPDQASCDARPGEPRLADGVG